MKIKYKNTASPGRQLIRHHLVCLVLLGVTLTGCRFEVDPFGQKAVRLDRAEQAFLQEDYPRAREEFTLMMEMATHPDTREIAGHGIACVDMIIAENPETFLAAMDSFLQASTGGKGCRDMNPQLLIRAVGHGTALMEEEKTQILSRVATLSAKEKKYKKERLKMQHLIKTLQHQISALESIDQERQEKRKTR